MPGNEKRDRTVNDLGEIMDLVAGESYLEALEAALIFSAKNPSLKREEKRYLKEVLGVCMIDIGWNEEAVNELREALQLGGSWLIYSGLANALDSMGHHEKADAFRAVASECEDEEGGTELDHSDLPVPEIPEFECTRPSLRVVKAMILRDRGRMKEALKLLDQELDDNPDFLRALEEKGDLLLYLDRYDEAVELYDNLLKVGRKADYLTNIGMAHARQGSYDLAMKYTEEALQKDPLHSVALYNKGTFLMEMGRYQEAIDPLERSLEIEPGNYESMYNIGISFLRQGLIRDAKSVFEQMKGYYPEDETVKALIDLCEEAEEGFEDDFTNLPI
jgi:tetratricopeptide (TPR) repeat protein